MSNTWQSCCKWVGGSGVFVCLSNNIICWWSKTKQHEIMQTLSTAPCCIPLTMTRQPSCNKLFYYLFFPTFVFLLPAGSPIISLYLLPYSLSPIYLYILPSSLTPSLSTYCPPPLPHLSPPTALLPYTISFHLLPFSLAPSISTYCPPPLHHLSPPTALLPYTISLHLLPFSLDPYISTYCPPPLPHLSLSTALLPYPISFHLLPFSLTTSIPSPLATGSLSQHSQCHFPLAPISLSQPHSFPPMSLPFSIVQLSINLNVLLLPISLYPSQCHFSLSLNLSIHYNAISHCPTISLSTTPFLLVPQSLYLLQHHFSLSLNLSIYYNAISHCPSISLTTTMPFLIVPQSLYPLQHHFSLSLNLSIYYNAIFPCPLISIHHNAVSHCPSISRSTSIPPSPFSFTHISLYPSHCTFALAPLTPFGRQPWEYENTWPLAHLGQAVYIAISWWCHFGYESQPIPSGNGLSYGHS